MTTTLIFPELLSGREDGDVPRAWSVRAGSTMRGGASCNLADRVLEVPLEVSDTARVVRAHELMHARVSPQVHHLAKALDEVTPRALECAEEYRVNFLLGRLGFDVSLLRDGTEKLGGRHVAEAQEWAEAVCFWVAVLGTGGERDYLAGIRQVRSEWLPALRAVRKRAAAIFNQSTSVLAATRLNSDGVPGGYGRSTLALARALTLAMEARLPATPEELRAFRRALEAGGRRPATGRFAPLVIDGTLERTIRPRSASIRRSRPTTSGTVLRYPSRLLTDDLRRGFSQRVARHGGVVVIDQSGSMDLDPNALARLLRCAPRALVLGYSHRPGDRGSSPNAWVLCDRGTVATRYPTGNVGNGVDGPALRWALRQREGDEPVVWVTDGQVTDSHDHPDADLTRECATLVRRHGIRLARGLEEAASALRSNSRTPASRLGAFGRVGRVLRESAQI